MENFIVNVHLQTATANFESNAKHIINLTLNDIITMLSYFQHELIDFKKKVNDTAVYDKV